MPYVRPTEGRSVRARDVAMLGHVLGLRLPEEDLEALAIDLAAQLSAIQDLEQLQLESVQPIMQFSPFWNDEETRG